MKKYRFTSPIDMPRGSHYGSNYWIAYSKKIGRVVTAFSNLEYYNIATLEMNPEVEFFCEQPFETTILKDNKGVKTVFDMWVLYKNGREEFQEIKYSTELDPENGKQRSIRQVELQEEWCRQNNIDYKIVTEQDLLSEEAYIQNILFLMSKTVRIDSVDKSDYIEFLQLLHELRSITIRDIYDKKLLPAGKEMDILAYMFYAGLITFGNIKTKQISFDTNILLYTKEVKQYEGKRIINFNNAGHTRRVETDSF